MSVTGIDVASYQSKQPDLSGRSFCFVKCTESTNYVNPNYAAQIKHARDTDVIVGHYHFVRPGSMSAQGSYFHAKADVRAGEMIALDWEDNKVSSNDKDALLAYLQAAYPKNRVVLYCNTSFWKSLDKSSKCADGLWIAAPSDPDGHPNITHPWVFQQTSIANGQDVDLANFSSKAALQAWTIKSPVVIPTKPVPPVKPTPTPKPKLPTGVTMNEPQMVASVYKDLMQIKRVNSTEQHAAGFFLATTLAQVEKLQDQISELTTLVQTLVTQKGA